MYRSQDNETLDELRAENAELKEKLSERRRLRFKRFLSHAEGWFFPILGAIVVKAIILFAVYCLYSCDTR